MFERLVLQGLKIIIYLICESKTIQGKDQEVVIKNFLHDADRYQSIALSPIEPGYRS